MPTPKELFDAAVAVSEQLIAEAETSPIVQSASRAYALSWRNGHTRHRSGTPVEIERQIAACSLCADARRQQAAAAAAFPVLVLQDCCCQASFAREVGWTAGEAAMSRLAREYEKRFTPERVEFVTILPGE